MENLEKVPATNLPAPVLALDLGEKRVGLAISDDLNISIKPLKALQRTNWKQLLRDVSAEIRRFDAKTVVIGFPLALKGGTGDAAEAVLEVARKFALSLEVPVYLQDERLTSVDAEEKLRAEGNPKKRIRELVDSEAAAIILRDFLESREERLMVRQVKQTV